MHDYGSDVPHVFSSAPTVEIKRMQVSHMKELDYDEPVLIEGMDECGFHRMPSSSGEVLQFLLATLGECKVPVSDETDVTLNNWYSDKQGRYLKDWHINESARQAGQVPIFTTPKVFTDWLNEYFLLTAKEGLDFQFLYWGDKGSQTRYHEDVVGTFSWSYNVCGTKKWRFYVNRVTPTVITCTQRPGDMIFIPSGCYHTVSNEEDNTISINQNWFNEHNIVEVGERVVKDSWTVKRELDAFEVKFDSVEEENDRIELIVKSNNCVNIGMLLELMEWICCTRPLDEFACTRIREFINTVMRSPLAGQFADACARLAKLIQ